MSATASLRRDAHAVWQRSNRTRVRYTSREIIQNKPGNTRSNYSRQSFPSVDKYIQGQPLAQPSVSVVGTTLRLSAAPRCCLSTVPTRENRTAFYTLFVLRETALYLGELEREDRRWSLSALDRNFTNYESRCDTARDGRSYRRINEIMSQLRFSPYVISYRDRRALRHFVISDK